jgi:hypothetical protein
VVGQMADIAQGSRVQKQLKVSDEGMKAFRRIAHDSPVSGVCNPQSDCKELPVQ